MTRHIWRVRFFDILVSSQSGKLQRIKIENYIFLILTDSSAYFTYYELIWNDKNKEKEAGNGPLKIFTA